MRRPCIQCGVLTSDTRCAEHRRQQQQRKRQRRPYSWREQQRRKAAVDAWVAERGYVCPGWQRESHWSTDLTADHIQAVADGGSEDGPLVVLCRPCNSRKGKRSNA